jgi:hypothetical protein
MMNKNWTAISLALGFTLLSSLATSAQETGNGTTNGDAMKHSGTMQDDSANGNAMDQDGAMQDDSANGDAMKHGDAMQDNSANGNTMKHDGEMKKK